ncbi:UbiA prenyltransferase family protein [Maribacter cobaltidurans]|uniref:Uncharacterized protein n=1 Tax=Maribacter cobaltidurans TaxID=1178778 RepID=A0A223V202_9FLAO|nr:hypothetical protein [Maribacter cobaltidurans]ASV29423.1 hypothetical protein CJ263_03820 [Maribacter cobaltidurans]GGD69258.1 hypothetical protein GCM10011412_03470 [Maribacter cobaltidurans]
MEKLQRLFNFYINASIHVAFGVFALTHVTIKTFSIQRDEHLAWFLFFGTIVCYNFIKYGVEAEKYFIVANPYQKNIQIVSFISFILGCYHAYFIRVEVWLGIMALVFLTGLYAIPVLPNTKNLRSLGGLKIFIVALVWAGATVILPVLGSFKILFWDIWVEAVQRFFFVLLLLIPFEIRDLKYDNPELRTLPQRFGVRATQLIGALLAFLFYLVTFLKDSLSGPELIVKTILFLGLLVMMFSFGKNQKKYFASFWVEGIPVVWYVLLVLCLKWY